MPKSIPPVAHAPNPVGPYSVVTEANGLVFVSGQVALDPATGARITGGAATETHRVMENIRAILGDVGLSLDDVVKTTIFVTDIGDYAAVNEVYAEYFPASPPTRSAVQVATLPLGASVEIEVVAAR